MQKLFTLLLSLLLCFILADPAFASDNLNAEVKSLHEQIRVIREGSIQSNSSAAEAINSLQELTVQFESLKATIDANAHAVKFLTDSVDLKLNEIEARIAAMEERLAIQGKQVTTAISTVAPEAAAEAELYQAGLNQVNSSAFLKAIATFKKFMKKFPASSYSANAQYWIGECYFTMRDYEQSIREFQTLIKVYPKSEKIPAALLKQGYAFMELDMDSDARLFLNRLMQSYPRTKEAKEAKDRLERLKKIKADEKRKAKSANEVPLAPGVAVPNEAEKYSKEKYQ